MNIYTYIYIYICKDIHVCVYTYMFIYIYTHTYIHIYIYIYIHIIFARLELDRVAANALGPHLHPSQHRLNMNKMQYSFPRSA